MTDSANHPGPGRSTAEAALKALKKEIAERNEKAHQAYIKLRDPQVRAEKERKRRLDLM